MYPSLFDFLKDVLGIEIAGFRFINTFGFFVALAFLSAFYIARDEFKKKAKMYDIAPTVSTKIIGKKVSFITVGYYWLLGFIFGYKMIGIFFSKASTSYHYITSTDGSWLGGLLIASFFAYIHYKEQKKQELPEPQEQKVYVPMHAHSENMLLIIVISGLVGAKIFHNLEHIDELIQDPINSLFSFSGLTFYGGLICATFAALWYVKKNNLQAWIIADSVYIGVLMAYGIGRFGCHFAGDGDWGISNTSPNPFAFLPDIFWSYDYPNNVIGVVLSEPVFPTPLYEAIICIALALILKWLSGKIRITGMLSGIYFILVGIERFFIEKIRINPNYTLGSLEFTQAEMISTFLIISGIIIMVFRYKHHQKSKST